MSYHISLRSICCAVLIFVFVSSYYGFAQQAIQRIGLTGPPLQLSLVDAITRSLAENQDIVVQREIVAFEESNLLSRRGAFDFRSRGTFSALSENLPVGSLLAGGGRGSLSNDTVLGTIGFDQNLPFGGSISATLDTRRFSTTNLFNQLNPQFPSFLNFAIEFPLLRDFRIDARRRDIRVASKNVERSEADFQRTVLDVVTATRNAYWELVFAREDVSVRQQAVDLAQEQVGRNERLFQAGQVSEVAIVEAQAELQRRLEELYISTERVTSAENTLKQLIAGSASSDIWNQELIPLDRSEAAIETLSVQEAVSMARRLRPELESIARRIEAQEIDSQYFRNQTKPRVDLVGGYTSTGLAGRERTEANPFTGQNVLLEERIDELSRLQGLPPLVSTGGPGGLPSGLIGSAGQSLQTVFHNDFRTVQVGVRIDFPFQNRQAEGDLGRSLAVERQLGATRSLVEQQIETETRNALQALETARQRLEAARAAVAASERQLESETRLFQAGETTTFFVLTRQNELTASRARAIRAEVDRNIAIARLQRILGSALQRFNITIQPR